MNVENKEVVIEIINKMKKTILLLFLIALITVTGCVNNSEKENQLNRVRQYEADSISKSSKDTISELPLHFEFGMTNEEVNNNLNRLLKDSTITSNYHNLYYYDYVLETGKTIPTMIKFGFYKDSLYALVFSFSESPFNDLKIDINLISEIDNDISSKLDSTYNRISYYEKIGMDTSVFTKWYKGNQYIYLRHLSRHSNDINFVNAPVHRIVSDYKIEKTLDEIGYKAGVKVENSPWDGSVYQVKNHLKNNLKDPDSYEGIEWSTVVETKNGYTVRHKYRAKNSFGGYVVENQIFYLDFKGNVISVSSTSY